MAETDYKQLFQKKQQPVAFEALPPQQQQPAVQPQSIYKSAIGLFQLIRIHPYGGAVWAFIPSKFN